MLIRRITLAALVAALVGGSLALPASSKTGPVASASKCKKGKKGKHGKKKKKKCGGGRSSEATLPGQSTHSTPTQPPPPPPAVGMSAIGVTDNPVLAGSSTPGQVTISGPARSGGQPVALQSSDPTVTVPTGGVVVAAGQTTAGFSVDTTEGVATAATLTASIGGSNVTTNLSVVDHPSVASVTLQYKCFPGSGSFGLNRVNLDVPAPADTAVGLSTTANPLSLTLPFSTATVPSGSKSALFGVDTGSTASSVTVTASLSPSPSKSATALVRNGTSPAPAVTDLTLNPDSLAAGGSSIGTVTLDCEALSGGALVALQSSDTSVATVPPNVNVLQDQLSKNFDITVVGIGTTTITATGPSGPPQTAILQVNSLPT